MEGSCRFEIWAYAKDEDAEKIKAEAGEKGVKVKIPVRAKQTFRLGLPPSRDIGMRETEPATEKGIVGQSMRHTEAFAKIALQTQEASSGTLISENIRLSKEVERLQGIVMENLKSREEMVSRQHERALAEEELRAKLRQKEFLVQQLVSNFAPHLKTAIPEVMKKLGLAPDETKKLQAGAASAVPPKANEVEAFKRDLTDIIMSIDPALLTQALDALPADKQEKMKGLMIL
jgi:hypothetical protein